MSERVGDPSDVLLVEVNPGDVRLTREAFEEGSIANTLHVVNDGVEALEFLHQRVEAVRDAFGDPDAIYIMEKYLER